VIPVANSLTNLSRTVANIRFQTRIQVFICSSMFKVYLLRTLSLLFSLDTDPTEVNNVFDKFPSIVMTLLEKLSVYDKNSYPTFYPPRDPAADPVLHQGWWGPWKEKPNNWPRDGSLKNDMIIQEMIAFENDVV